MTGRVDQERAPIYETLTNYVASGIYGFHTPGHKSGRFAAPELTELVGKSGLALDLPAMTATDNTFHPTGCVRDAQQLAAELFGAGETFLPHGRLNPRRSHIAPGGRPAGRHRGDAAQHPSLGRCRLGNRAARGGTAS